MIEQAGDENAENNRGRASEAGCQQERQLLCFIADFTDGDGKEGDEKSFHEDEGGLGELALMTWYSPPNPLEPVYDLFAPAFGAVPRTRRAGAENGHSLRWTPWE